MSLGNSGNPQAFTAAQRLQFLVQSLQDHALFMLDPGGLVATWNTGAQRLFGWLPGEITGQHFSRFFTPEDVADGLPGRVLDESRATGRFEAEGWRLRKDGSRFVTSLTVNPVHDDAGTLIGFAAITRDISERVAAQQALMESDRHFRLLVQGVVDYAIFMLDPNGVVTNWNEGAQRMKGYRPDEIVGQHFSRFYTEEDRAAGLPARVLYTATREGRFEAEGWRVRKNGSLFWANAIVDAIRDDAGKLVGFAKITRDITERRNAQLALHEAQKQRAQAQKLEALGHLTGGVAHDFNNLLMVVGGYVQTLRKLVDGNARGVRAADAIELAAQRGQALTRQLLSFARRQPLNAVAIDLGERLASLRPMLKASAGPTAEVTVSAPAGLWPIKVDSSEFDLALINLVVNASDADPDGGTITVSAENVALAPHDTPTRLEGPFVAIAVADHGCGIPPDVLERVFDPFFTTKPGGTGLGLSQVHGMAHQSGGTVTIRSELGRGTRITLYFPRSREVEQGAAAEPVELGGHGVVLLVEDNPDVAGATAALLEELGFAVRTAADAQSALRAAGESRFDLVVTDIVMAGPMNGLDLARSIRAQWPDLPIVLVTGYSDAAGAAADEFTVLRKPYRLEELGRAIAAVRAKAAAAAATNVVRLRNPAP